MLHPIAMTCLIVTNAHSSDRLRKWAAISAVAGSLLTRIAWVYAGHESAQDWRVPLREGSGF